MLNIDNEADRFGRHRIKELFSRRIECCVVSVRPQQTAYGVADAQVIVDYRNYFRLCFHEKMVVNGAAMGRRARRDRKSECRLELGFLPGSFIRAS